MKGLCKRCSKSCVCKQSKTRNSFITSHSRQVFSHPQKKKVPSHAAVTWGKNLYHSKHSPFILLPLSLCTEYDVIWCGIPFWSLGVTWLCFLPVSHELTAASPEWQYQKKKRPCVCVNPAQQQHRQQYCVQHKSKTQPHASH